MISGLTAMISSHPVQAQSQQATLPANMASNERMQDVAHRKVGELDVGQQGWGQSWLVLSYDKDRRLWLHSSATLESYRAGTATVLVQHKADGYVVDGTYLDDGIQQGTGDIPVAKFIPPRAGWQKTDLEIAQDILPALGMTDMQPKAAEYLASKIGAIREEERKRFEKIR